MKTLESLKNRKEEIIELTLDHMSVAFNGDPCNVAFYVEENENGEIEVNHYPFLGQQSHPDKVFWIVPDHQRPDPEALGYNNLDEVDWNACGFDSYIKHRIEDHIMELESRDIEF